MEVEVHQFSWASTLNRFYLCQSSFNMGALIQLNFKGLQILGSPNSLLYRYCAEVLSALPFGLPDEPLYIVYTINRAVQVRGGVLEANMKAAISDGHLGVVARQVLGVMAAEKEQEGEEAYNVNATEEEIPKSSNDPVDNTEGIPDEVLDKLRVCDKIRPFLVLLNVSGDKLDL